MGDDFFEIHVIENMAWQKRCFLSVSKEWGEGIEMFPELDSVEVLRNIAQHIGGNFMPAVKGFFFEIDTVFVFDLLKGG